MFTEDVKQQYNNNKANCVDLDEAAQQDLRNLQIFLILSLALAVLKLAKFEDISLFKARYTYTGMYLNTRTHTHTPEVHPDVTSEKWMQGLR